MLWSYLFRIYKSIWAYFLVFDSTILCVINSHAALLVMVIYHWSVVY